MLETKSKNNGFEFAELPTRKRKREAVYATVKKTFAATSPAQNAAGFTNAAFSSTPKRVFGRRRIALAAAAKENTNPFAINSCLEVKSIEEIAKQTEVGPSVNPYEVIRKPPKKKLREDVCFENLALNLDFPEKQFNPFEILRQPGSAMQQCFVNKAFSIRGNDVSAVINPYEIQRHIEPVSHKLDTGVENHALSEELIPANRRIGLPFRPCVGCRIDFSGLPLSQFTPSKLLAEKLVFSPIQQTKLRLSAINEDPSMDIGKELDQYQLELENSINEAKLRKHTLEVLEKVEVEQRVTCTHTLTEISGVEEQKKETEVHEFPTIDTNNQVSNKVETKNIKRSNSDLSKGTPKESECKADNLNADVVYASDSEDDDDVDTFKAPTRFVRAYRPASSVTIENKTKTGSKESLHSLKSNKSIKSEELMPTVIMSAKNIFRKSIRKIMHPSVNASKKSGTSIESEPKQHHNIISSIRHSLRRRPQKVATTDLNEEMSAGAEAEISIIDSSERVMKLKSSVPQTEYMTIEQLTNETKHTLRNSIRRSTREVMRHVFHKNQEAYITQK